MKSLHQYVRGKSANVYCLVLAAILLSLTGVSNFAFGQDAQLVHIRTFDQQLAPFKNISVSINNGDYFQMDNKGSAYVELAGTDLAVKQVNVKEIEFEAASWNYSKGVLEIIIRKKSYQLAKIQVKFSDSKPLANAKITFNGQRAVESVTGKDGSAEIPLALGDKITSANQFSVPGFLVKRLELGAVNVVVVEKIVEVKEPVAPIPQVEPVMQSRLELSQIDSIQSLSELFSMLSKGQLSEETRKKIEGRFQMLLTQMKDSISRSKAYMDRISSTSIINEDIKNLLNQVMAEEQELSLQREDFIEKIKIIEGKLEDAGNLSPNARNSLLADLTALEKLLSENESRFYKNHNDYKDIINTLKEKYFDIEELETKLSESEARRLAEQKLFRQRLIVISVIVLLLILIVLLLFYFSKRLNRQKKELTLANEEINRINENLEVMVSQRTNSLEKANIELDTFLYRASHDLRSPLASIKGLCNISAHVPIEELMDKVKSTIVDMDGLLNKLAMVSDINHSEEVKLVSLDQMAKAVQLRFQKRIDEEGIEFIVKCPTDTTVLINPVWFEFILINLIENALFFSGQQKKTVRTVALTMEVNNGILELDVFDNGMGITMDIRKRIFTMFFKGTEKSKGNGLGLYIVFKCIQALDGTIDVQSEDGKYTRFLIGVPLVKS